MLSRVAENLYWMSRYLERAEHTARLLDVAFNVNLDQSPASAGRRWRRLQAALQATPPAHDPDDAYSITESLTFDASQGSSILSCIVLARDNAQQVREQISSEMWEQLNRLFHQVKRTRMDAIWHAQPHDFFRSVREGAHLFQGIADSTMSHGEGWQFIQAGRFLERANATAVLLDVHFSEFSKSDEPGMETSDYLDQVALLKFCTAFEAYCKVYTADLRSEWIAEFLTLDPDFPRSVSFSTEMVHRALRAISQFTNTTRTSRLPSLAGRLRATLSFSTMGEIMEQGLHPFLADIQRQCGQIHQAIYRKYIQYPIESAVMF